MNSLPRRAEESFSKKQGRLDVFSDVFGSDFDVVATTDVHSMVTGTRNYVPIRHELEGAYQLELLNNLRTETRRMLQEHADNGTDQHPDVVAFRDQFENTTHSALSNRAPRVGNSTNGNDFYAGITFEGMELYGVPLASFSYVRDRIATLMRVPTDAYFGRREQFRSARVVHNVRTNPRKLELVYDVDSPEELARLDSKKLIIPDQEHLLQLGFVDEFGNTRLRGKNAADLRTELDKATNQHGVVGLVIDDKDEVVIVHRTQPNGKEITCLREVPDGKLGMYTNVNDETAGAGYFELVRKWTAHGQDTVDSAHTSIHKTPIGTKIDFVKV